MISKSDLVILVVASAALGFGVFRWHQNTQDVNAITIPASNRVSAEPAANKTVVAGSTRVIESSSNQVVVQTLPNPEPVPEIVVNDTTTSSAAESVNLGTHLVRSGDYLGKIANQYGTDVNTLRDLNGITGTVIHVGEEILYPL